MIALVLSVFLLAVVWAGVAFAPATVPIKVGVAVTAALALTWLAVLAWRLWKARRASAELERSMKAQAAAQVAAARPDEQADIEAMQAEFAKAVEALKRSKLGRASRDALAVLPWYLIIGPPGAGKTTALRASGLKFPYLSKRGGVRGIGGTRNCEWWMTNEAVILDTAGRYATEVDDHEEWTSFLRTVKRARPRKPINGLIVAVPVADLLGQSDEQAAELGQVMRQRVDEVLANLEVVLPVYVLVTKCDLLPGFVESFADLRKGDRGQVWGFSLGLDEQVQRLELATERFDGLVRVVDQRALERLADERQLAAREHLFEFPQQLGELRGPLVAFLDSVFAEDVYKDVPILRGVYLTSGTQEGRLVDRLMSSMAEAFGLRVSATEAEPVLEARSYFLRDVFTGIIFKDQGVALLNARAARRDRLKLLGASVLVGALLLGFVGLSLASFLNNRGLASSSADLAEAAVRPGAQGLQVKTLEELEPLRERVALLADQAEHGAPWSHGLGFYQGDALLAPLAKAYALALRRLLLDDLVDRDAQELDAFTRRLEASSGVPGREEYARAFEQLKLHLLLTAPRADGEPATSPALQEFVGLRMAATDERRRGSVASTRARMVDAHGRLFARLVAREPALALPRREGLVQRVRVALQRLPLSTLVAERLASLLDGQGKDLTLAAMLDQPSIALRATATVRGAFTRRGHDEVIKKQLGDLKSLVELWVLAAKGQEAEALKDGDLGRLSAGYYERYVEEWRRFLESVTVEQGGLSSLAFLQELTRGEPPPLKKLIEKVAENTRLGGLEQVAEEGLTLLGTKKAAAAGSAKAALGALGAATFGPADVERAFAGLVSFGRGAADSAAKAGGGSPNASALDAYLIELAFVQDGLRGTSEGGDPTALLARVAQARTKTQALLDLQESAWRPRLQALLWPPLEAASSSSANEASRVAAATWCSVVALPFQRKFAGRYPFARSANDAAVADVAEFFRPGSGVLWGFFSESLRGSVQRSGEGFQFARQVGGAGFRPELLGFLQRANDLTAALFPAGAAEPALVVSARVKPTPRIATVVLDVEGQHYEYRNGPDEWFRISWPGAIRGGGASIRVRTMEGNESSIIREGDWALLRLVEAGELRPSRNGQDFTVAFPFPELGATVQVDFHPSRSETPFLLARRGAASAPLEPFRIVGQVPANISRGGGSCE